MKRRRPWVPDAPGHAYHRRFVAQHPFPFLEMLPEMRREVVSHVTDHDDRAALARTCKQHLRELGILRLPGPWQHMWNDIRVKVVEKFVPVIRHGLREMIRIGVTTWPGAFRYAFVDIGLHSEQDLFVSWNWEAKNKDHVVVSWYPNENLWRTGHVSDSWPPRPSHGGPVVATPSLDHIAATYHTEWHPFVTQPRPLARRYREGLVTSNGRCFVYPFDEDTPLVDA